MENINEWYQKIEENINKDRKIILLAGASSSGKSYTANTLETYLESKNKKVLVIPADMYYKGITRIIVEKTFLNNPVLLEDKDKIVQIVREIKKIIKNADFNDKLSQTNLNLIKDSVSKLLPKEHFDLFYEKMQEEFKRINFDDPFDLDFLKLVNDIKLLQNGKTITVPTYSFRTGETELYKKDTFKGLDYDAIIIEGLYVLRHEVLDNIDQSKVIKTAIDCDIKTVLARRFNRDIKSDRCTFTPEQTIISFISQVMPAFYHFIYPTFKNADIVLDSKLSQKEIASKEKNIQIKYETTNQIYELLNVCQARLQKIENHRDYFLEDKTKENCKDITLRIREENGFATKLSIKINSNSIVRAIEEYDLVKLLDKDNREIKTFLQKFVQSGYEITNLITKNRKIYDFQGAKLTVDNVDDLGIFIELENKNIKKLNKISNFLMLTHPTIESYYNLYLKNIPNLEHIECEEKFKLTGLKENDLKYKYPAQKIKQFYIDLNNESLREKVNKTLNNKVDLDKLFECRVRVINNEKAFLTLKSKGLKERKEIEKEIPLCFACSLIKDSTSSISKTRYTLLKEKNKSIEVDFYDNKNLCIMEMEHNPQVYTEEHIKEFASQLFGNSVIIEDVTKDKNYKNYNLSKEIGK